MAWEKIVVAYKHHHVPHQYTNLQNGSFTDESLPHRVYPRLQGRGCDVKGLAMPLTIVWQELGQTYEGYGDVLFVLGNMCWIDKLLSGHRNVQFLPLPTAQTASRCTGALL